MEIVCTFDSIAIDFSPLTVRKSSRKLQCLVFPHDDVSVLLPAKGGSMKHVTISDLGDHTGFTYRTIKRRLQSLKPLSLQIQGTYENSEDALKVIVSLQQKDELSLADERAKLAKAQNQKIELEYKVMKGELVSAEEFIEEYSKRVVATKNRFLGIPSKLGARFRSFGEAEDLEEEAEELIHEALREMAVADASA